MMEAAEVTVALHIGTEDAFGNRSLADAPEFAMKKVESTEIHFEPFSTSTIHMAPETFLTALVLGGVFERHPRLRFGVIELGGRLVWRHGRTLGSYTAKVHGKRLSAVLSLPPSAYLNRNVRVTPFYFEPVDLYFERYPQLIDCYCYSTDYPHPEGGQHAKLRFFEAIERLGPEIVEKFFVANGQWLFPA